MFTLIIASCCVKPFTNIKCYSLSLEAFFDLKSILSNISMAIPSLLVAVCMEYPFLSFYFQPICAFGSKVSLTENRELDQAFLNLFPV